MVFFNGGPANNSHSSYVLLTHRQKWDSEWAKIPFIFVDQRGTGCSDPYPQGKSDETLKTLSNYGSRAIIEDSKQIRKKLGIAQWKVFGQSYGAFIVHRYMTIHPESIVSAHAHAGIITSDPIQRLTGRIRSQNRVVETYLNDFPSDREILKTLNKALIPSKCFYNDSKTDSVCGPDALSPFIKLLGFTEQWLRLHIELNLLVRNGALDDRRMQEFLNQEVFVPPTPGHSTGVALSVIGWTDRNVAPTNMQTCPKVYFTLGQEGTPANLSLLNECQPFMVGPYTGKSSTYERINQMPQDLLTITDFKASLIAHSSTPFYLYSGAKDTYVPVDDYKEELDAVGALVHYTHFIGTGHDGFMDETQVWSDLL